MSFETAFRGLVDEDVREPELAERERAPDPYGQIRQAAVQFVDDDAGVDRTFESLEKLAETDQEGARSALAQATMLTAVMNFAAAAWSPPSSARLLPGSPATAPGKVAKLWIRLTSALQKLQSLVAKISGKLEVSSITLTVGTPWTISIAVEF